MLVMERADRLSSVELGPPAEQLLTFESFFERHHRDLFAAMWLITRDRQESEEIGAGRLPSALGAVGAGRLARRSRGIPLPNGHERLPQPEAPGGPGDQALGDAPSEPDDLLESIERREVLVQALASLTPRERAAVVMTDVLGFTSEEAGSALGIKPMTVRVLASRGRGRLHQEVIDDDGVNATHCSIASRENSGPNQMPSAAWRFDAIEGD